MNCPYNVGGTCSSGPMNTDWLSTLPHRARQACPSDPSAFDLAPDGDNRTVWLSRGGRRRTRKIVV